VSLLHAATFWLAAAAFVLFASSVVFVFVKRGEATAGLTAIKVGALASAAAELAVLWQMPSPSAVRGTAGLLLFAGSLALFGWAARSNRERPLSLAFSRDLPEHLNRRGPYRHIRHPFYVSYVLAYSAGLVASGDLRLLAVVLGMGGLYLWAARAEESKFASSPLAEEYAGYRRTTGMFLPRWPWR
jgi:protein-S-isoprenylcysteine O-methyltransferase Ste14